MSRAWFVLLALVGCDCNDVVAIPCTGTGCDGDVVSDANDDAALDANVDADLDFCSGSGPLIVVGDTTMDCAGRIAERSFRYALCTCDGIVTSDTVSTDAFDSRTGPYAPPGLTGGSLGTNADLNATNPWSIGGSMWASGDWSSGNRLDVANDLQLAGRLAGDVVEVGRNAFVGQSVQVGELRVDGTLTVPAGEEIRADRMMSVGETLRAPVAIPPPCDCDSLVDIAGFVRTYATDNDNASIDLNADALTNVTTSTPFEFPCGRYYVSRITSDVPVVIRATGRVALFVDGDISVNDLQLELVDDAQVDVFVSGNVNASGGFGFGDVTTPARVRMYVGGTGTINLAADSVFAGNLYAPRAELVTAGDSEIFGAVFVERLSASGPLSVHYDTGVLGSGDLCDPPPVCDSCGDCPSIQACIEGACGACETDADCCAPLLCRDGECLPTLI